MSNICWAINGAFKVL